MTLFSISHLLVQTKTRCILSVDQLAIPSGHTAIIGPNGAGKSTLLRSLLGLHGSGILLRGQNLAQAVARGEVAWVGQHGQFNLPLTVAEYVLLGCAIKGGRIARLPERQYVHDLLLAFDLAHLAKQRIGYLSGGEQQRANIVRALLQNTSILLLDEPCNHLDIRHQHRLMHYLRQSCAKMNVVMVLHDLNMAANYADYVILMNDGQVVCSGSPKEMMTEQRLSEVYQWQMKRVEEDGGVYFRMHRMS